MIYLMISTTANKTSINFDINHMWHLHNQLLTLDISSNENCWLDATTLVGSQTGL
jgi:hypothetical protein